MAEGNLATEGGILLPKRNNPRGLSLPGGKLSDGWRRNDLNLIVPSQELKVASGMGVLSTLGMNNLTDETGNSKVAKVAMKLVTDSGDFNLLPREETADEVLKTDLTKVTRAMHNPGQYITNSLESHGEAAAFQSKRVTKDIFERVQKVKTYFDKSTGKNEKMTFSSPGLMEKYLVESVKCVGDHNLVNSEAPKYLSSHASELLKKARLDMEMEAVPEMPNLVEAVIFCLNDKKIKFDKETRGNLYNLLEQVTIPKSLLEEVAQIMDKKGDLGHDLALKLFFELRQEKPDCDFLKNQKERRRELLSELSGTPQEIFDDFSEISQKAMGLVVGVDMDDLTISKIGVEVEYKPDLKRMPNGNIPDRFTAGTDDDGVVEIRTNNEKLIFGEKYMEALYQLETWLEDQPKEKLATLHLHLDTEIHPKVGELMEGMNYTLKNNLGTEIWGMGLPDNANGLINLMNFLAVGSKERFDADQKINISETDSINWRSLMGGYFCSSLVEPESRLAIILAMRGEKNLVLFNPFDILLRYNFSDLNGMERLEIGLSEKQKEYFKLFEKINKIDSIKNHTFSETKTLSYIEILGESNADIKDRAFRVLQHQESLSKEMIDKLTEMLGDGNEDISKNARNMLRFQKNLPRETIDKLTEMLGDSNEEISFGAYDVLKNQTNLSKETIDKLTEMLSDIDNDSDNECYARDILQNQRNLPRETVDNLIEMLSNSNENIKVRARANNVLRFQTNLPREITDKLVEMLGDSNVYISSSARDILQYQDNLSRETVDRMTKMLGDSNEKIRDYLFKVLRFQINLPRETTDKLVEMLGNINIDIRISAIETMQNQRNLPRETTDKLAEMLGNSNWDTRHDAKDILFRQTNLPRETVDKLTEMLGDVGGYGFDYAFIILQNQKDLPRETVDKLTEMLDDSSEDIREMSFSSLQNQRNLPRETTDKLTEMLDDSSEDIREMSFNTLQDQKNLPRETIDKLIKMLDDNNEHVSYKILEVLNKQEGQFKETKRKIIDLIRANKLTLDPWLVSLCIRFLK